MEQGVPLLWPPEALAVYSAQSLRLGLNGPTGPTELEVPADPLLSLPSLGKGPMVAAERVHAGAQPPGLESGCLHFCPPGLGH